MDDLDILGRFAIALLLGLLLGAQRGWVTRELPEGGRIAGIRTFGLIAVFGAACDLLNQTAGGWFLASGIVSLAVLSTAAQVLRARHLQDYGLTTTIASLLAYALGAMAMEGLILPAVAVTVVAAFILEFKQHLHGWIRTLEAEEIRGGLKFLIVTAIILPILPDRTFGPGDVLNPYRLWLYVVLISAISLLGYIAVKLTTVKRGLMLTAIAGGLFASTAVALNYSRLAREKPELQRLLAAGVIAASATMFPRVLLIVAIIAPSLIATLAWPLLTMAASGYFLAAVSVRRPSSDASILRPFDNPFELGAALKFGLLLALVMVLVKHAPDWAGDPGVLALAALSGLADVDAITISLARMTAQDIDAALAAHGILTAVVVNTAFKALLSAAVGGRRIGGRVATAAAIVISVGALGYLSTGPG
jgi:uncharacterized membrane protein (DUF4010 family)